MATDQKCRERRWISLATAVPAARRHLHQYADCFLLRYSISEPIMAMWGQTQSDSDSLIKMVGRSPPIEKQRKSEASVSMQVLG